MPEESFEERTEAPTPKRRSEAREKGNVAKSTEVNSALVLLAGALILQVFGGWMFREIHGFSTYYFRLIANPQMTFGDLHNHALHMAVSIARVTAPVCLGILFVGLLANVLQTGFLLTLKPLEPKLEKINPLAGFKRLFGMRALVETAKNILKIAIIGIIAYVTVKGEFERMLMLGQVSVGAMWLFLLETAFTIIMRIVMALLIIAILDYAYQRYEHEKKLKMTHQEVKEERKQMEGDPQVKGRIRSLQREMARRRMMQEVPKATVVVTNPTYIAIALQYEPEHMDAPLVLAKGKRTIAEKIKAIARENRIPVVEDKPLARAMYDKVEPGDAIPYEFFTAVAEILAYVFRLKNRSAA
jgi:flagellar biosynthetic protein FlhB